MKAMLRVSIARGECLHVSALLNHARAEEQAEGERLICARRTHQRGIRGALNPHLKRALCNEQILVAALPLKVTQGAGLRGGPRSKRSLM